MSTCSPYPEHEKHNFNKKPQYSRKWAENVLEKFLQSYARGTQKVAKMLDMDYYRLITIMRNFLMRNQFKWEVIKKTIKNVQKDGAIPCDIQDYLTHVKQIVAKEVIFYEKDPILGQRILDIAEFFDYDNIWTG